nr:glycosyltransferase [Lewinella sp. W8]
MLAWGLILRPAFRPPSSPGSAVNPPPVSIIVCFRNEAQHLEACLSAILRQAHPDFEILAVDDNSTDDSAAIVRRLARADARLRYLPAGPTRPGKKDALSRGIRAARHERVLLTDADCLPATDQWATHMAGALGETTELALGVSLYRKTGGGLLHHWQTFESVYVALQYLGFARMGVPYMGVGRNLAYRKSLFERAGGFARHADLPGGDDDLLVNQMARADRTATVTDASAWTWSLPKTSWRAYWRQKRRHQSAGHRYRPEHQLLLTLLGLSHGLFFLLGLWGLFSSWWLVALAAYFLRLPLVLTAVQSPFHGKTEQPFIGEPPGRARGRKRAGATSVGRAMVFDVLLAPHYLVMTVLGMLPAREW